MAWRALLFAVLAGALVAACFALERDAARGYEWQKRGQIAADLTRQYCEQASKAERAQFLYGFYAHVGRWVWISIRCGEEPVHSTPPASGPEK